MWVVISGFLGRLFGLGIVKHVLAWIAFKAFILACLIVVFPIVHHSLVLWGMRFAGRIMASVFASLDMPADFQTVVLNLTGVGAYLAEAFQLPECFSIILSAYTIRLSMMVLSYIPIPR